MSKITTRAVRIACHRFTLTLTVACSIALAIFSASSVRAVSSSLVISQVYGGGGNSGATLTHDFVELYNRGTEPVDLAGWSVQSRRAPARPGR